MPRPADPAPTTPAPIARFFINDSSKIDTDKSMQAAVIVATRGRPETLPILMDHLLRQIRPPRLAIVVGAGPEDVASLDGHPLARTGALRTVVSSRPGLCAQRNAGLDLLKQAGPPAGPAGIGFIAFFDDDFRPACGWLAEAARIFDAMPEVAGLTGRVLADGIKGPGLSEQEAEDFLAGRRRPVRHTFGGTRMRPVVSAYGCNMAFRTGVFDASRFDEQLPLYGWQEDRDFTARARALGRVVLAPACVGVHLGAKAGRTAGVRFGYSQIANPAYLVRKGTMRWWHAVTMIGRNLVANHCRALHPERWIDRRGRARGNWLAIRDLALGRARPRRVMEL